MTHSSFYFYFQVQKQNYRQEKKRAAKELSTALKDPSVVIMSNWLKVWGCLNHDKIYLANYTTGYHFVFNVMFYLSDAALFSTKMSW